MDSIDEAIIGRLMDNARATYNEIGVVVGLSAPAVKRRVDRMQETGVIRGFTVQIDHAAMGWSTEAYVEIRSNSTVSPAELAKVLEPVPEIVGAWTVTGDASALVHILAKDVQHLDRTIERIRDDRKVDNTRSAIVLSRLVDRPTGHF